jgi:hypothetical protein
MDHHQIEEQNIPDLYLMGRLLPEERARFEEHFVDCPSCLDRLETTEAFRGGLRTVAAEEGARTQVKVGIFAGALAIVQRKNRMRRVLLLGGVLILAALPTLLWLQNQNASSDLQRRYEQSQQSAQALERALQDAQQRSAAQQKELEALLEREREERKRLETELEALKQPSGAIPSFILNIVRGDETGRPVNRIRLPSSAPAIVLSPEFEPDPDIQSFRATLLTKDNRRIWNSERLRPGSKGSLAIRVNAGLLGPGDYTLVLEGFTREGRSVPYGRYPFQTTRR